MQNAYLGTYQYEQANYQLKPRNEMDDWLMKERYKASLKQPKAGKEGLSPDDGSGYFIGDKTLDVIPGADKAKYNIDESKFKNGKLVDEYEEADTTKNVGPITGFGSAAGSTTSTRKVKTTKERKIVDDARRFLIANNIPAMNDQDVLKKIKDINQIGYGRSVMYVGSDIKNELTKVAGVLTKDNISLDLPDNVRAIGSKGDTKTLKDLGVEKRDDIENVQFEGFNVMYDEANKERPGDLVYSVNVKGGKTIRVVQNLEAVNQELANNFKGYQPIFKALFNDDLSSNTNITKGKVFSTQELLPVNSIVPHKFSEIVKVLPVKSFNKATGKLEFTLNPKIEVNGKWYDFNQNELNTLTQNGSIKPEQKDTLDDLMMAFKLKSNGANTLNYSDLLRSMRNDLFSNDFVKGAMLNAKAKNTIQVQTQLFNQQVEE